MCYFLGVQISRLGSSRRRVSQTQLTTERPPPQKSEIAFSYSPLVQIPAENPACDAVCAVALHKATVVHCLDLYPVRRYAVYADL